MRFTDAYAACPVCSPTRASIMTGKYPTTVGITDWIPGASAKNKPLVTPEDIHELPLAEVTFPEVLKSKGYRTFFAGKWHLGNEGFFPEDQGFDINRGGNHKGSPPGGYFSPYKNPRLTDGAEGEYLTDRLAEESVQFIEAHTNSAPAEPFLLYLSFYTVHTPIQAKKDLIEKYDDKLKSMPPQPGPDSRDEHGNTTRLKQTNTAFASMVQSMDEAVGKVLERIKKSGIEDDTIIIFMSDNGGLSTKPSKGNLCPTSNLPLRAGKGWLYEGGIREPMIIKWPGVTRPGSTCSEPVTSTDFYPTILDMLNLPPRPDQHKDGVSLVPLLKGARSLPREAIYWHYPHYHGSGSKLGGAIRAGDYKLIEFFEDNSVELYNLKEDLGEQNDLAKKMPEKVAKLKKMLRQWRKKTNAKMPRPNPDYKE